jgi:ABC-type sugar transport system ATPase subunit
MTSTRVLVMGNGRVAGMLERPDATPEKVMQLMAGRSGTSCTPPQTAPLSLSCN